MTIYLYVKTHTKTGLKYLGKTSAKDPCKYRGSGKYWLKHLKKYGYDYSTEILKECQSNDEIKYWGLYYSNLWNVVESKEWANLKPETGDGIDSLTATRFNNERVKNGTHPFLGGEVAKKSNTKRLENKTHPFLGGSIQRATNARRLSEGSHTFLKKGFQHENNQKRLVQGTHNMLGGNLVLYQLETGSHSSQIEWSCPHCNKSGKGSTNYKRWHGDNCKLFNR